MRKTKTTEQFIEDAVKVHGDKYDYSKVEYKGSSTKVTITCPIHGDFEQTPGNHLYGQDCKDCSINKRGKDRTLTTEQFVNKAKEVHGSKYDYSKVDYISSSDKVTIICPVHGEFEQIPSGHLEGKGCKECGIDKKSKGQFFTTETFIEKANDVHDYKYNYSKVEYKGSSTKVTIICPVHGDFEQVPSSHLYGHGCPKCFYQERNLTTQQFIEKARSIHVNKYEYFKVDYKNSKSKVTITCPIHGDFTQQPNVHLVGHGCPECADEHRGFWNPDYIQKHHLDRIEDPCTLYVIECYSNEERFIKVGITTRTLEERYDGLLNGYQYNTLYEYHSTLIECSEIEQDILYKFKDYQYEPTNKFGGSTECLQYTVLNDILTTIKEQ